MELFVAVLSALLVRDVLLRFVPWAVGRVLHVFIERDSTRTLRASHTWSGHHSRAWRLSARLGVLARTR